MGNTNSTENIVTQQQDINQQENIENVILNESSDESENIDNNNIDKDSSDDIKPSSLRESFQIGASASSPTLPNTNFSTVSMVKSNSTSDLNISQISRNQSQQQIQNNTGSSDPNKKIIEGELQKRGHVFKNWRARWFKIDNGHLLYFKSKEDEIPIDKIPLRGSRLSKKPFYDRPNTFELISTNMNKVFLFQGKDLHEVDFWMTEIAKESKVARKLSRQSSFTPQPNTINNLK